MGQHSEIRVAVIGLGVMGTGIARAVASAGMPVLLFDSREGRAVAARREILDSLERRSHPAATRARDLLVAADALAELSQCGFLVEAINEDLDAKRNLLASLGRIVADDAIVASNTSSLPLSSLGRALPDPRRFVGLHFFVPAHANPLVEVGRAAETAAETMSQATAFARSIGKQPLTCRDAPGFIVNRFYLPLINEAMRIVEEGLLSPAEADAAAIEAFGLSIGPFEVCRMGRLSTTLAAVSGLAELGRFYEPCRALVERGTHERQWPREQAGESFKAPAALVRRLRAAVFFAILDALDDEVAEPDAFDEAAGIGLRFGRPPFALMGEVGRDRVEACVSEVAGRYGAPMPQSVLRIPLGAAADA